MTIFSSRQEEEVLLENLAMLLDAGVGMGPALDSVATQVRTPKLKKALPVIRADLDAGSPLWKSLEEAKLYPQRVISLLRIGERSGKLVENLDLVADQYRKERSFRAQVQSALFYPAIVFSLTVIVGLGVSWFVLPRLAGVFSSLDVDLPVITQVLLGLGSFLQSYGVIAVPLAAVLLSAAVFFLFFHPRTRAAGEAVLLAVPGLRNLLLEVELARFGHLLGGLLKAGIPIDAAIQSLREAVLLRPFGRFYDHLLKQVGEGDSLEESFASYRGTGRLFPVPIQALIFAAEKSGQLPEALLRVGRLFEERSLNTARNITTALEPILLFLVWLGVAGVAVAVILPIYSLIGQFNP